MKKAIVSLLFFSLYTLAVTAQSTTDFTVRIDEIKNPGKGTIVLMLFDQKEGFPKEKDKARYQASITDFGQQVSHTFSQIPQGTYAVAAFWDKNDNGKIDTNFIGMPKEPVAASNLNKMGRPKFQKSSIVIDQAQQDISIRFIND
ncbi:MAG: DUF2141 domain-containing protein [Bacteroidota bacterium]